MPLSHHHHGQVRSQQSLTLMGMGRTQSLSAPYVSASAMKRPHISPSSAEQNSTETFSVLVRRRLTWLWPAIDERVCAGMQ